MISSFSSAPSHKLKPPLRANSGKLWYKLNDMTLIIQRVVSKTKVMEMEFVIDDGRHGNEKLQNFSFVYCDNYEYGAVSGFILQYLIKLTEHRL